MLGSHLSVAGGMVNALHEATLLGLDTVQVFTKNQQQWKVPALDPAGAAEWQAELNKLGWQGRTVSHASYLINLASVDDELFTKSVDLMTVEIERCEALSIPYLVHHPGSFKGWSLEEGIARIAHAYRELFKRTKGMRLVCCLEGTAGAGSHIGGRFEHLAALRAQILEQSSDAKRVGFCLDTCHLHVAGYDMSTRTSARRVIEEFDALCGVEHLRVWHLNDSKGKLGSHLDRHEHIGLGTVGGNPPAHGKAAVFSQARLNDSGFSEIMQDPRFAQIPKILETPKESGPTKAVPISKRLDTMNLERLRSVVSTPATAVKRTIRAKGRG